MMAQLNFLCTSISAPDDEEELLTPVWHLLYVFTWCNIGAVGHVSILQRAIRQEGIDVMWKCCHSPCLITNVLKSLPAGCLRLTVSVRENLFSRQICYLSAQNSSFITALSQWVALFRFNSWDKKCFFQFVETFVLVCSVTHHKFHAGLVVVSSQA